MSEIDKLINQAFPDELRDIEPIDVDEDAILGMTLEHLGLKPSPKLDIPELHVKPLRRRERTGRREKKADPEFVEVPVVVHHRWMDWAGWAIAACLVLVFAVNWGPWLLNNLDFGLGPRSTGEVEPSESGGGKMVGIADEYILRNSQQVSVNVSSVSYGEDDSVTIDLTVTPVLTPEELDLDQFDIKVTGEGTGTVVRVSRSNAGSRITLKYELHGARVIILDIKQAMPLTDGGGNEVGFGYQDIDKIQLNFNSGEGGSLNGPLDQKQFQFDRYGAQQQEQ